MQIGVSPQEGRFWGEGVGSGCPSSSGQWRVKCREIKELWGMRAACRAFGGIWRALTAVVRARSEFEGKSTIYQILTDFPPSFSGT